MCLVDAVVINCFSDGEQRHPTPKQHNDLNARVSSIARSFRSPTISSPELCAIITSVGKVPLSANKFKTSTTANIWERAVNHFCGVINRFVSFVPIGGRWVFKDYHCSFVATWLRVKWHSQFVAILFIIWELWCYLVISTFSKWESCLPMYGFIDGVMCAAP